MHWLRRRGPRIGGLVAGMALLSAAAVFVATRGSDDSAATSTSSSATSSIGPAPSTSTTSPEEALGHRPVLPTDGAQAATGLAGKAECRPAEAGRSFARLSWTPAASTGSEQRVAVTIYRDGFEHGTYRVGPALPPDRTTFDWEPLEGQAVHHWRVLTLQPDGWRPSSTAGFDGPTCPSDQA